MLETKGDAARQLESLGKQVLRKDQDIGAFVFGANIGFSKAWE